MSKELNRYSIVEYRGYIRRVLNSIDEYNEMINKIKKHNKNNNKKRFYGNISKEIIDGKVYATIHAYNKLTPKMQITALDEMTSHLNEKELIDLYKDKLETKSEFTPDLNIAYFKDKNQNQKTKEDPDIMIKYTPILYKEDLKYFDKDNIYRFLNRRALLYDLDFFNKLTNYFSSYKSKEVIEIINKLDECLYKAQYKNSYNVLLMKLSHELFDALTIETDKDGMRKTNDNGEYIISRKRLRDFAFFVKYYESHNKVPIPTMYNKSDTPVNCEIKYNEPVKPKVKSDEYTLEELEERIRKEQEQIHEEQEYDRWDLELKKRR